MNKEGYVDNNGLFKADLGPIYEGLSVKDEKTNELIINMLKEYDALFSSYKYQNIAYKNTQTEEKIGIVNYNNH